MFFLKHLLFCFSKEIVTCTSVSISTVGVLETLTWVFRKEDLAHVTAFLIIVGAEQEQRVGPSFLLKIFRFLNVCQDRRERSQDLWSCQEIPRRRINKMNISVAQIDSGFRISSFHLFSVLKHLQVKHHDGTVTLLWYNNYFFFIFLFFYRYATTVMLKLCLYVATSHFFRL